jgi:hypothetical protein
MISQDQRRTWLEHDNIWNKGSNIDLSREEVWAAMEGTGWRPVSQIAIDDVWSALRFRPIHDVKSRK